MNATKSKIMKQNERQLTEINFELSIRKNAEIEHYQDLTIISYDTEVRGSMKPAMKIWKGKQKNPFVRYYYESFGSRVTALLGYKVRSDNREADKAARKAERKAFTSDHKVGDIYTSSWGYEQTNVDFYQVIETKGKSTVVIQKIAQEQVDGSQGMDSAKVVPIKGNFLNEEPLTKRVGKYGLNMTSYSSASKWDGTPQYKSWGY